MWLLFNLDYVSVPVLWHKQVQRYARQIFFLRCHNDSIYSNVIDCKVKIGCRQRKNKRVTILMWNSVHIFLFSLFIVWSRRSIFAIVSWNRVPNSSLFVFNRSRDLAAYPGSKFKAIILPGYHQRFLVFHCRGECQECGPSCFHSRNT